MCNWATCFLGECVPGEPNFAPCDDGIECTINDVCNSRFGCFGEGVPQGTPCNDGEVCTIDDMCFGLGFNTRCIGTDVVGGFCEADGNECTSGTCVDVDGQPGLPFDAKCIETPVNEGSLCDDDNECTEDRCNDSGKCVVVSNKPADTTCGNRSDTECTNPDSCDSSGFCLSNNEPIFTPCGDAETGCFFEPFCDGILGICAGSFPKVGFECDDGNECTAIDVCDFEGKCFGVSAISGTSCGDSSDGECINPDSCDGIGNCQSNDEPDDTSCDDGELCTIDELCKGGICTMGTLNPIPACFPDGPAVVGGKIIPIEATSLILAGTQTTVSWLIPVTVSAIGIAIVIARKFSKYQPV